MNRPRVIINCAMSADGKIALPDRKQMKISSEEDMKRVFQLRNACDAILVGIGSILSDDPKLTVKEKYVSDPKHPLRVVLDSLCQTPEDALVVNDKAPTLIMVKEGLICEKKYGNHVDIIHCPSNEGRLDLHTVLSILYKKQVSTLLVEGGGSVIWEFLSKRLVDDLYVFVGSIIIGGDHTPTMADGMGIRSQEEVINLNLVNTTHIDGGMLVHYTLVDE